MDDKIDFYKDINNFSTNTIMSHDGMKLNLQSYNDVNVIELILKWKQCFDFLGKGGMFVSKKVQLIIYCLLSDYSIINFVNKEPTNLALYNTITQSFFGFDVVNANRIIKIKLFNVCNEMVIIECCKYPVYKIYNLHNLNIIKEFYGTSKINFDTVKKDICLLPVFIGNINNLKNDFKKLSVYNFNTPNRRNVMYMELCLKKEREIEKKITDTQNELFDIYSKQIIRVLQKN